MAPMAQVVTIVNNKGKIVSSGKQLVNVFKEAKAAYRERKAEITATRDVDWERKKAERRALKYLEDDNVSQTSSTRSRGPSRSKSHRHPERPPVARGYTDSFYANDNEDIQHSKGVPIPGLEEQELPIRNKELVRRHTDGEGLAVVPSPRRLSEPHTGQSQSARSSFDEDLAYGDLPPPLPVRRHDEEVEIRAKMTKLQVLLDEANCVQHSATAMVEHLQKNPDALAAVALTLAEVSNLATKMAPGALMALKSSFPAVMALLASPQFLIAAGLGVGVTVVMLGGYKIIKRIKETKEKEPDTPMELQELDDVDLSRIELWRRGIADVEAESPGSTVDGEFITPAAGRRLAEEGVIDDTKSNRSRRSKSGHHHKKSGKDDTRSKDGSSSTRRKDKDAKKKKEPSGLKLLFQGKSAH